MVFPVEIFGICFYGDDVDGIFNDYKGNYIDTVIKEGDKINADMSLISKNLSNIGDKNTPPYLNHYKRLKKAFEAANRVAGNIHSTLHSETLGEWHLDPSAYEMKHVKRQLTDIAEEIERRLPVYRKLISDSQK